ncbi:MAG: asparagine synthase (glutamine-hydrolyzing) [Pseudomonadota bacterium]
MCGIAGFVFPGVGATPAAQLLRRMTDRITHRGPDAEGQFLDPDLGVGLGHRRLSIVDLSETGAQPMHSPDGRFVLAFNGEIYNFQDLKQPLVSRGMQFRGSSDTEVLLTLISENGLSETLSRLHGMFALALWDRERQVIEFARDRLGEKPLYIGIEDAGLWFASELKARSGVGIQPPGISHDALSQYLRFGYVPDPLTIHEDVFSLPAGTLVRFSLSDVDGGRSSLRGLVQRQLSDGRYWNPTEYLTEPRAEVDESTYQEHLHSILRQTISRELVADVPVGSFLSGGIDSTLVTAIAQDLIDRPLKTYTIGFDNKAYDESSYSQAIADHLGCDHHCRHVTGRDAFECIDRLSDVFDQPFANSSALPSLLLADYAASEVKVCLTGDGADEVFGGYNRYIFPPSIQRLKGSALGALAGFGLRLLAGPLRKPVSALARSQRSIQGVENKLNKLSAVYSLPSEHAMFEALISVFDRKSNVLDPSISADCFDAPVLDRDLRFFDAARDFDVDRYLSCENLPKVDRTAMAFSLETRSPFLDHAVVEAGLRAPANLLIDNDRGKLPLRGLLDRYVPRALMERPKMGFSVPIDDWLDGDLSSRLDELLDPLLITQRGLFDKDSVQRLRANHKAKRLNSGARLWTLMVFQQWAERHNAAVENGVSLDSALR